MQPGSLHEHAVQAEAHLEKLATGLAQAGADQGTVQVISQMADVTRKIVKALGKGQEQTGDTQPPRQEQPPPQQQQPQPAPQRQTMDSAIASTHEDMQRSAQQQG